MLMTGWDWGQEGLIYVRLGSLLQKKTHTSAECRWTSRSIVCSTTAAFLPKTSTLLPSSSCVTLVPVKSAMCLRKGS